jgi:hypothetical protein
MILTSDRLQSIHLQPNSLQPIPLLYFAILGFVPAQRKPNRKLL